MRGETEGLDGEEGRSMNMKHRVSDSSEKGREEKDGRKVEGK